MGQQLAGASSTTGPSGLADENSTEAQPRTSGAAYLVVGDTPMARRVCATLHQSPLASEVCHLVAPVDGELGEALQSPLAAAAVLIRDDVAALRYALALAHLRPALPLTVTIFDRTIAEQLRQLLPQATVLSPAAIAVPSLAGACLDPEMLACFVDGRERAEVRRRGAATAPSEERTVLRTPGALARVLRSLRLNPRDHDPGTRMLLVGLLGMLTVLTLDWLWLVVGRHHGPAESFVEAARVVATVGPAASGESGGYGVFAGVAMLLTIGFTAVFTAGLIDRLVEPRLVQLLGPRAVPRARHVVVIGLGQVGVRLCAELRRQGIPVVGIEWDRHAPHVTLARSLGVPVVVGDGSSRAVLERLRVDRCLALAAVGSDDLDNVAVAVAASAVAPDTRIVLRAGEQEAVEETRALLPLGTMRDATEIAATLVVATVLGDGVSTAAADDHRVYLRGADGRYEQAPVLRKGECRHSRAASAGTAQDARGAR